MLLGSLGVLALGAGLFTQLRQQFFPSDLSYLSYVDVWLSEDAPLGTRNALTQQVEAVIRAVATAYGIRSVPLATRGRDDWGRVATFTTLLLVPVISIRSLCLT